jgi:hypothetical protein
MLNMLNLTLENLSLAGSAGTVFTAIGQRNALLKGRL